MDSVDLDMDELFGEDDEDIEAALVEQDIHTDGDDDDDNKAVSNEEKDEELDVAVLRALDPARTNKGAIKRTTKPRIKLDSACLLGPRGLKSLLDNVRQSVSAGRPTGPLVLRGPGHEVADLRSLLRFIELWGHRLYPKANMNELTERFEWLGAKREVRTLLRKMRLGDEDEDAMFNMQMGAGIVTSHQEVSADNDDMIDELLRRAEQDESQFVLNEENEAPSTTSVSSDAWQRAEANRLAALQRRHLREQQQLATSLTDHLIGNQPQQQLTNGDGSMTQVDSIVW